MEDPVTLLATASVGVVALALTSAAGLKAWSGWLDVKRLELTGVSRRDRSPPSPATRIEMADLKERVRKLEAIASGIEI